MLKRLSQHPTEGFGLSALHVKAKAEEYSVSDCACAKLNLARCAAGETGLRGPDTRPEQTEVKLGQAAPRKQQTFGANSVRALQKLEDNDFKKFSVGAALALIE